jgi:membrane-associated protease RseP (regulator of RpoE activity)
LIINRRRAMAALAGAAAAAPVGATLSLAGGLRRTTLAFELIDNRLFVQARVNGSGPLAFIVDTGGGNILDLDVAQRLGLPLAGRFEMPGAGEGTLPAWRTQVAQANMGALQMRTLPFVVLPLAPLRRAIGFAQLDGLIGHEVLRRFVLRQDFVQQHLVLAEPGEDVGTPAGSVALPVDFVGNLPHVAAWVDGLAGRLAIDSGDRSSLTLFTPFVDEHRLRLAYPRSFHALTGWGVGGPLPADVTQVAELLLGPLSVRGVTTRMPTGRGGVFASSSVQGSVGTGVLKRLDVTFDYAARRVFVAPNARHATPDPVDHSGLWLQQGDGAFEVAHVSEGGPAQAVGLSVGDRVLAIDGRPTAALVLAAVRQRWAEAGPGLEVELIVHGPRGSAGPRPVRLTLHDRFAAARGAGR